MKIKSSICERYSLENMAASRGLCVEDYNEIIAHENETKQNLISYFLQKGYTQDKAETFAWMCLNIPGFSGKTFHG